VPFSDRYLFVAGLHEDGEGAERAVEFAERLIAAERTHLSRHTSGSRRAR